MLFLSQVVGKPVLRPDGEPFGKVRDLIVALGERYPPVTGLVVRVAGGREIFLPLERRRRDRGQRCAAATTSSIDITTFQQRPNEIRLWLDLQDKQIVDVEGRKIVRVNDIQLAPVRGRLRLMAVDVGLAGILRRLGLSGPGAATGACAAPPDRELHRVGGRRPGRVERQLASSCASRTRRSRPSTRPTSPISSSSWRRAIGPGFSPHSTTSEPRT